MKTRILFDEQTITAGGSSISEILDLGVNAPSGFLSIQLMVSGSGTAKVEYMNSNLSTSLDSDYVLQSETADVITSGFTATSGPGSDGKDLISLNVEPANRMKIKVSETGGASSIVVTIIVCMV